MVWRRKNTTLRSRNEVAAAWRRSLRAAVSEDWTTAETWLERIVEADSSDLDAYHALARLYRQQGAVGRAIRMHQNLLLRPDLPDSGRVEALFELALDLEEGGFAERAVATYEEVLDEHPRHFDTLVRVIPLLLEQREYPRALSLVRTLRRKEPDEADRFEREILLAQARDALDEGNHRVARKGLKQCLRRDKSCAPAWAMLGELEAERGKSKRALDAWRRAATADQALAAEFYPKIDAGFSAMGKGAEFHVFLREILATRPDDFAARLMLARSLSTRGDASEAIEELARAIEVAPEALALRAELGRQLLAANQESEALKAYTELIEQIEHGITEGETLL